MRVYAVARMMQDQMFPDSVSGPKASDGFQSGTSEERRGNVKVKTTKISWADMAKRVKAGENTSIKAI